MNTAHNFRQIGTANVNNFYDRDIEAKGHIDGSVRHSPINKASEAIYPKKNDKAADPTMNRLLCLSLQNERRKIATRRAE